MYIILPMFFYMVLGLNDFYAGKSSKRPLEGRTFCPERALASLVDISGPKKSRFSGPNPSNGLCNRFAYIKIIRSRAI